MVYRKQTRQDKPKAGWFVWADPKPDGTPPNNWLSVFGGSVCLYQGEELGLAEADVAYADLQDPYGIEFWPEFKGRGGCRTPMVWEPSNRNAGFSTGEPWLPVSPAHLHRSVATQEADDHAMLHHYRRAIALRKAHPGLVNGAQSPVTAPGNVVSFTRTHRAETIFCVFNLGDTPATETFPAGKVWTVISPDPAHSPQNQPESDVNIHLGP